MKKIILTIVAVTIIFLSVGINARASEVTTLDNGVPLPSKNDECPYMIVYELSGKIKYVQSHYPLVYSPEKDWIGIGSDNTPLNPKRYGKYTNGAWSVETATATIYEVSSSATILYCNYNILNYNTGEVFFSELIPAPPVPELVAVMQKAEAMKTLEQVMKMIPIGMACLVGYLGLRIGLKYLLQLLRMA